VPELTQIARAVDHMLAQQEPLAAVAVERRCNLLKVSGGAVCLVEFLLGPLTPGQPSIWPMPLLGGASKGRRRSDR
jgi:hypothetical protein